ncbi:porphobilinogen synthase [Desulfoplanes formicivorans]|uniref:Delta-aminolevulinic acid dehydratase n=1 Tax=Desulfoplanes formicivorans TaxID=1592317 RepID=A0A194AEF1_9BACT|nr:porphobilinogen synthase [Desulfoplanes formicivorans]GAU07580.1 delta-aminolevulinic acid dehydratase [Desulfoplanes formicivorans]
MTPSFYRGRRLRRTPALRDLIRETEIRPQDLIQPYFVVETSDSSFAQPIASMPGQYQFSLDRLEEQVARSVDAGLRAVILFGIPAHKDPMGTQAYADTGIVQEAVRRLKTRFPDLVVITDVCMCEFTSHGHCGILEDNYVQNDVTLNYLAKTALSHARAGADMVAPSDMMDGRIQAIRMILDENGFKELPIMSYAVKSASSFYGPFRDAAESAPAFGDRKSYQMDPANLRQAMCEAEADLEEGADIIMVKPALPYLDVLRRIRDGFNVPTAAYQVSGEYSMVKAGAQLGWIDEQKIVMESLTSIKRAGADLILTYFAEDVLTWLA